MSRVATLVERSRYARSFADGGCGAELPTVTPEIRHGIAAPADWQRRLIALFPPRVLFRRKPKEQIGPRARSRGLGQSAEQSGRWSSATLLVSRRTRMAREQRD